MFKTEPGHRIAGETPLLCLHEISCQTKTSGYMVKMFCLYDCRQITRKFQKVEKSGHQS